MKVGIIGAGRIGKVHAKNISMFRCCLWGPRDSF